MTEKKEVELLQELFVNRNDCYAEAFLNENKKKGFKCVKEPLTEDILLKHLNGEKNIGVYQLNKENKVKWGCLDFDKDTEEDKKNALKVYNFLVEHEFNPLLEKSGGGINNLKVHIWIFSKELIPALQMKSFLESICKQSGVKANEIFPKQTDISNDGYGNLVKLPLGIHPETKRKSELIETNLEFHSEHKNKIPIENISYPKTEVNPFLLNNLPAKKFDDFFKLGILQTELPNGSVYDVILKNMSIWLFNKNYSEEEIKKYIKPIYDNNKWDFNNLLSWYENVKEGKFGDYISLNELIKWCEEYKPELIKFLPVSNNLKKNVNKKQKKEQREIIKEPIKEIINEEKKEELHKQLVLIYHRIIESLKLYLDLKEEYYPIITCWIIGTYIHEQMLTYPYLYFNATKESGKSRSVRLITYLSKDGEMVNSLTEAVLFRTKGTIGIDEFEKASRKGNENLIELLNSAYKKGTKVKRMRKARTPLGEEQVLETFEVFRPIIMANIWGIDNVLEDRAFTIMLEKTTSDIIPNLLEIWEFDTGINEIKEFLTKKCSLCSVVTLQNVYMDWNNYLISSQKNTTNYITTRTNNYTNYTKLPLFEKIKETGIKGRMLELSFPIIMVADMISEEVVDSVIFSLKNISIERNQDAYMENKDILITDMISQEPEIEYFISIRTIVEKFKQFSQNNEEWINEKWIGRSLKRLGLIKEKKRTNKGIEIKLDYQKAKEKMRMFK